MPGSRSNQFDGDDDQRDRERDAESHDDKTTTTGDHATDLALTAAFGKRDPDGSGDPRLGSGDPQ